MTPCLQPDRLTRFLHSLDLHAIEGKKDAFMAEVLECGGTYVQPRRDDEWSSHLYEVSVHGVIAVGATEAEAIRNWIKVALAIRTEDDPPIATDALSPAGQLAGGDQRAAPGPSCWLNSQRHKEGAHD